MVEDEKRKRGRSRKTLDDARAKRDGVLRDGSKPKLTRAEYRALKDAGEHLGERSQSPYIGRLRKQEGGKKTAAKERPLEPGIAYALNVAAEWEAQIIYGGASEQKAKREAARLAVEALKYLQDPKTQARMEKLKPIGGRVYKAIGTIWEFDPVTGKARPVSELENARDCGDEVPELLAARAERNSSKERSLMDKIMRKMKSKAGTRAREAAQRTAAMGELGSTLQANGIDLPIIPRRRRPKA
ncbi:MAG: hypothetical protein IOC63_05085 [Methylobacterium sp.]|nr:hypothetical protein [Methylobacterium sp.]